VSWIELRSGTTHVKSIAFASSLPNRKIWVAMKMYPPPVLIGSGRMSFCF
jgi:hypothetical protein